MIRIFNNTHLIEQTENLKRYYKEINRYPILKVEEEEGLYRAILRGDKKAKDLLVNCNLRFVVTVAKAHTTNPHKLMDLINEGNRGLVEAVERFDPTKGYKFISYAVWWIKNYIIRYNQLDDKTIRIPQNIQQNVLNFNKAVESFLVENERYPTDSEIRKLLGGKTPSVHNLKITNQKENITKLENSTTNEPDSRTIGDVLDNGVFKEFTDEINNSHLSDLLNSLMERVLDFREIKMIKMYYGIGYEIAYDLETIGKEFHITREATRQILIRARYKLKNNIKIEDLV